ncbi:hypothetical protein [Dactylosporangium darangshiense]|uniref:Uncharacterized protein n=1 Tax=Dactylosporangium darangshiense TaxID=579108 RepID=A0ABP8DU66_9ACTN
MSDDCGAELFEASLMLLAGTSVLYRASTGRTVDPWAVVDAHAVTQLRVEFEAESSATWFADVMQAMPDARCSIRRRVAGIRRQYETFVVHVDGAEPSTVVGRLHSAWIQNLELLLGNGASDERALRARAAAVWRVAMLTAAPRVSSTGLQLRARDRSSARLLLRAAQLLGVTGQARTSRGFQVVRVEGRGVITLLSTVRSVPGPFRV